MALATAGTGKASSDDAKAPADKWIMHYSSAHKILLVGEGDFSFALSLAKAFGSANNMVATSLNSRRKLQSMYRQADENLNELEKLGCTILHGVFASSMHMHPALLLKQFHRIVFNFPHTGFELREHDPSQIRRHQKLVSRFFGSAGRMVTERGEVHVTHKTAHPFDRWDIEKLAVENGLQLLDKVEFCKLDYPGYNNKRGDGDRCDQSFPIGQCQTYKFVKFDANAAAKKKKKKKKKKPMQLHNAKV